MISKLYRGSGFFFLFLFVSLLVRYAVRYSMDDEKKDPSLLALDFDGVLCDGLAEYFQTSWRVYQTLWPHSILTPCLEPAFASLRPVVETGWEMPLVIRALCQGISPETILQSWPSLVQSLLQQEHLEAKTLGREVDQHRDAWIRENMSAWIAHHRFYPGVVEQLRRWISSLPVFIVTTKERRFVKLLLESQGVFLPDTHIIGKESQTPKATTLKQLQETYCPDPSGLWFIEDRFRTLQKILADPELDQIQIFLADWGYNTAQDREAARIHHRIKLVSLEQFTREWMA
jgi:phosphoglycolate phosphatase-like HAD superfamily hydrolase